jgi:hypothetical protein
MRKNEKTIKGRLYRKYIQIYKMKNMANTYKEHTRQIQPKK